MDDNQQLEQDDGVGVTLPIRANDPPLVVTAYTVWNRMIENRSLDVKRACEETGVPRWQFYEALNADIVQAEVAQWLGVMATVEAKFLRDNWYAVLSRQLEIATGNDTPARDATAAARFLEGVRLRVEAKVGGAGKADDKKHPAAALLDRYKSPGRTTLRRTTTVEEIEIEGEEQGTVIDG